jgi:hypothetical protein
MHGGSKRSARSADATQELLAADVLEVVDARPASAEATQELQAADVLEVLPAGRPLQRSASSIAPVGFDLPPLPETRLTESEELDAYNPTRELSALPRRHLGPVVIGTVTLCAVILIIAGLSRLSRSGAEAGGAGYERQTTVTIASKPPTTTAATANSAAVKTAMAPPTPTATTKSPAPAAAAPVAAESPTTGTIVLGHPGRVWLDGKRLTGTSALVRCGSHRIKLGAYAKSRAIDVPCGGEVRI